VEDVGASEPCWISARFPSFSIRRPCRRVGSVIQVMLCSQSCGIVGQTSLPRSRRQQNAIVVREACPAGGAQQDKHKGHLPPGKPYHQWQKCGRQCIMDTTDRVMAGEPRTLGERLRRATIPCHGMCCAGGGSMRWLMRFLVTCFAAFPDHRHGQPVASPRDGILGQLEVAGDELGSRVKQKANKQGVWRAMDQQTRQSLACRRSALRQCKTGMDRSAGGVSRASTIVYGSICRRPRGDASCATPSEHPARPDNQLSRAFQEYGAAACLPSRPG
jgi:insertion element IS1 protein InsB